MTSDEKRKVALAITDLLGLVVASGAPDEAVRYIAGNFQKLHSELLEEIVSNSNSNPRVIGFR